MQSSIWPFAAHTSDALEMCSTGKAEMKEKPSSLNKENVASRAN